MSEIQDCLVRQLARDNSGVTFEAFQTVVVRLLDKGILINGETARESELYHIAVRAETALNDYLSVTGCRLVHDRTFEYFRLYPPGADVPGMISQDTEFGTALRASLPANVVAGAIILRFLYGKALQQGKLDDDAEVQVSMEEFFTSMQTLLKREVKSKTERREMFSQLRALRLIRYGSDDDLTNMDAWMIVRPTITGLVSEAALEALMDDLLDLPDDPNESEAGAAIPPAGEQTDVAEDAAEPADTRAASVAEEDQDAN